MSALFRRKAMDRLSSPEQLDRMVVITPPLVWLAVAAGFILVVVAALWAFLGNVYSTAACNDLYFDKGHLAYIYAPVNGVVTECNIARDAAFQKGDLLYKIVSESGTEIPIQAPSDGYADAFAHTGYYASRGSELLRYWQTDEQDKSYVFCLVPYPQATSVKEGMKVMFYPVNLDEQYYGHLTGKVVEVSDSPVSTVDMYYQVGNQTLIDQLYNGEAYVAVYCSLDTDSSSDNGYYWTNENGKTVTMVNEMQMTAEIIVSRQSPISLLLG